MFPCLTHDLPGIGGRLKTVPDDFVVEERLPFEPPGHGEHLFLWIEKRGVSHERLVRHIADSLRCSRRDVGTAGMKDRHAVTRQYVSVPAHCESRLSNVETDDIRLLTTTRNPRKLKTGKLRGNRFRVLLRGVDDDAFERAERIVAAIRQHGFPNYFGSQRFGVEGHTLQTGFDLLQGRKQPKDLPRARRRFLLRLSLSAVQSWLFNRGLASRLQDGLLLTVLAGDVMQVTASGGLFVAEDVSREQERLEAGAISVTGPIFGRKMRRPDGVPATRERELLEEFDLTADDWAGFRRLCPGTRRPFLVQPDDLDITRQAEGLQFEFSLPSGSYATVLLQEFMKHDDTV